MLPARRTDRHTGGANMSGVAPSSGGYFLFDAALLHGTEHHAWLLAHPHARCLYDDLGEQAVTVGPLCMEATQEVADVAQDLARSGDARRFACARLVCHAPIAALERHLRQLRHLVTGGDQRYYFRYADSRATRAVWRALTEQQQADMLGPITSWDVINEHGRTSHLLPAGRQHQPSTSASLPLVLSPSQWHQVLETSRIGELMEATYDALADTPCQGDDAQRRSWTLQTMEWLRHLGVDSVPLQVATNQVMWLTGGIIYRESLYAAALREAKASGRVDRLLAFSAIRRSNTP